MAANSKHDPRLPSRKKTKLKSHTQNKQRNKKATSNPSIRYLLIGSISLIVVILGSTLGIQVYNRNYSSISAPVINDATVTTKGESTIPVTGKPESAIVNVAEADETKISDINIHHKDGQITSGLIHSNSVSPLITENNHSQSEMVNSNQLPQKFMLKLQPTVGTKIQLRNYLNITKRISEDDEPSFRVKTDAKCQQEVLNHDANGDVITRETYETASYEQAYGRSEIEFHTDKVPENKSDLERHKKYVQAMSKPVTYTTTPQGEIRDIQGLEEQGTFYSLDASLLRNSILLGFISLPETEVPVGYTWEKEHDSIIPYYNNGIPLTYKWKYTFSGYNDNIFLVNAIGVCVSTGYESKVEQIIKINRKLMMIDYLDVDGSILSVKDKMKVGVSSWFERILSDSELESKQWVYHFKPGNIFQYSMTENHKTIDLSGVEKSHTILEEKVRFEIESVLPDKTFQANMMKLRTKININSANFKMQADTDNPKEATNQLILSENQKHINKPESIIIYPGGGIHVPPKNSKLPKYVIDPSSPEAKLANSLQRYFLKMPQEEVVLGETWRWQSTFEIPVFPVANNHTVEAWNTRFDKSEGDDLYLTSESEIASNSRRYMGKSTCQFIVDKKTYLLKKYTRHFEHWAEGDAFKEVEDVEVQLIESNLSK